MANKAFVKMEDEKSTPTSTPLSKRKWQVRVEQTSLELNEMTKHPRYNHGKGRENSIFLALQNEDISKLEICIEKAKENGDIDDLDHQGFAALHHVTRCDRIDAVKVLLKNGAFVDVRTRDDSNTPLHIASRFGWSNVVKLLLDNGADPTMQNANGSTPLHLACRRSKSDVLALLLNHPSVDVNAKDKLQLTPLHIGAAQGSQKTCQMLMDHGADMFAVASDQTTPIHMAIANGNDKCDGSCVAHGLLPKVLAQITHNVDYVIKSRDKDGNTLLHSCAPTKSLLIPKIIIELGADVNAMNTSLGKTPLHMACAMGNLEMTKILVENKARLQPKDYSGQTPLHKAAMFGRVDVIEYLLDNGADVDPPDKSNQTPFLVAVSSNKTNASTVKLLLSRGAQINAYDVYLKNCLHLAIENQNIEIVNLLLEYESALENLNSPDVQERVPLHYAAMCEDVKGLKALLTKQTRLNFQDEDQKTALYLAAEHDRAEHVEVLGLAGSSVNERNEEGKTPLHDAACKGNRKVCKVLIKLGADINSKDDNGHTPLMCAAVAGCAKTCKTLLEKDANMDDTSASGETALLMAVQHNNSSVVEMLMDLGVDVKCRDFSGLGVLEMAGKWNALDAVKVFCRNKRWREVLEDTESPMGWRPIRILIACFPEAATIILDKCITKPNNMNPKHPDYAIEYDFTLLDPGPDDPAAPKGTRYFAPLTMVEYSRRDLLLHPLTQALLDRKWNAFGSYIFYFSFFTYFVFLIFYTYFVVTERQDSKSIMDFGAHNTTAKMSDVYTVLGARYGMAIIILVFVLLHIAREIVQVILQGRSYFKDLANLLEWGLYTTATLFLIPYVANDNIVDYVFGQINDPHSWWLIAVMSIYLCYLNFVLFLRRFNLFGIYISMFLEVFRSVIKVMLIFIELLFAFAIVFYVLFKEQPSFNSLERTYLKTAVMTLGEMDFTSTFIESLNGINSGSPANPYPQVAFVFCVVFLLAMPITLMNLLVGLAVGDIEMVRRTAELKRLARQVEFVSQIEEKYPKFITRMIYKPKIVVQQNKKTFRDRFEAIGNFFFASLKSLTDEVPPQEEEPANTISTDFALKLEKNRRQIKALVAVIENQNQLLTALVNRIDPSLATGTLSNSLELDNMAETLSEANRL